MILVIDNYDSFTYNLVQCPGELGATLEVVRNDAMSCDAITELKPERVAMSPGPGTPDLAGVSLELIRRLEPTTPILGVCLGHQAIGQAYGATVDTVPDALEVTAWAEEGEIMGLRHRRDPVEGGQFHPESIQTVESKQLLRDFLSGPG